MVKLEYFHGSFEEAWTAMETSIRSRNIKLRGGNLARPVLSDSSQHPCVFSDKDTPFYWVWGVHLSHEDLTTSFQRKEREDQRKLPASAIFSNSFHLKCSVRQGAMFEGSTS